MSALWARSTMELSSAASAKVRDRVFPKKNSLLLWKLSISLSPQWLDPRHLLFGASGTCNTLWKETVVTSDLKLFNFDWVPAHLGDTAGVRDADTGRSAHRCSSVVLLIVVLNVEVLWFFFSAASNDKWKLRFSTQCVRVSSLWDYFLLNNMLKMHFWLRPLTYVMTQIRLKGFNCCQQQGLQVEALLMLGSVPETNEGKHYFSGSWK